MKRAITSRWSGPRRRYNSLTVARRACAAAAAQRHYVMPLVARRTLSLGLGVLIAWFAGVCVVSATFSFNHTRFSAMMSWVLAFAVPGITAGIAIWASWPRAPSGKVSRV